MRIRIPELALVALIGPSGCGKSTFAARHFKSTEVLSSDACRGMVSDDENDQAATKDAFEILHFIARKRLHAGKLVVVDATNVQPEARKPLVELAREFHCLPVAIVFDLPERLCHERNQDRPDRSFGPHVVRNQSAQLHRSLRGLQREGFRHVFTLSSPDEVDVATVEREPLWNNRKGDHGPFDIIGDVHGCLEELTLLLGELGYRVSPSVDEVGQPAFAVQTPDTRKAIFLGDLTDRGPDSPGVLRLVMGMVAGGQALCVPGNHDVKLMRKLRGRDVQITHGLGETLAQLDREPPEFRQQVASFLDGLISHYVLDDGKLVVAHAGLKESMQGRGSGAVREFALYGETTGETDEFGLPIRYNWAGEYRGKAMVVYGHTPVPEPEWLNRTINLDTGCVFGGKLTALRYPEGTLVSVPALKTYAVPVRPFLETEAPALTAQQEQDDLLDIGDLRGKRAVETRLQRTVMIREGNAAAALEVMSRFAADPHWLIYLPATMSPTETARSGDWLEHPAQAFDYYHREGIPTVVCEEKHMGSRAIVVVCRDEDAARRRFGVLEGAAGACFTRTGRPFFDDPELELQLLDRVRIAATQAGLWDELKTDWLCLDCELMPWSAKAQSLIRGQYAAVGAAAAAAFGPALDALSLARARPGAAGEAVEPLLTRFRERADMIPLYRDAYRRYSWPVRTLGDLKLAPFHLLAAEGHLFTDRNHLWHMETLSRLADAESDATGAAPTERLLMATAFQVVDLNDADSRNGGVAWWEALTASGGEGMVVKPLDFMARGARGLVQPAVKCRGREYLRLIYGPEYAAPANLERLRERSLGAKRSLALREFALGVEALERFVRHEPLRRVHECVFGVLALESEPVDPRL